MLVRRNVYDLDPNGPELRAYARGITAMKKRPLSDPTSWAYQANIHGTEERRLRPGWNSCQHGSWFFPSWHRMYLYWFERIVRKASGLNGFALPYWNYEKDGQEPLPAAFRRPAKPDNALYVEERSRQANGGETPSGSLTSSRQALATEQFISTNGAAGFGGQRQDDGTGFLNGALEQAPHNTMHVWIGGRGLMSAFETAARDPIFWLHHANIDRLWEVWLAQEGGRSNPTDEDKWMNETFVFFDEDGRRREMSGRQIVDIVRQLDYEYDDLSGGNQGPQSAGRAMAPASDGERTTLAVRDGVVLGNRRSTVSLAVAPGGAATPVLELTDVSATVNDGFAYEIYVGLRSGGTPDFRDPAFVGTLSSFGMPRSGQGSHAGHGGGASYRFAIEGGLPDGDVAVTFVPVVTPDRANAGGNVRIGRLAITG